MPLAPIAFRVKKRKGGETVEVGPWKAVVGGKVVELGDAGSVTKEEADAKLKEIVAATPEQQGPTIGEIADAASKIDAKPEGSVPRETAPKADKPPTGSLRAAGLSELTGQQLAKLRDKLSAAIAEGNLSLDTALIAMFGRDVPQLPPEDLGLLRIGWEIACQEWFVNGVPPAWVIILFANVQLTTKLAQMSTPKKKKEEATPKDAPANPDTRNRVVTTTQQGPGNSPNT